jgi:hypothetical protein
MIHVLELPMLGGEERPARDDAQTGVLAARDGRNCGLTLHGHSTDEGHVGPL